MIHAWVWGFFFSSTDTVYCYTRYDNSSFKQLFIKQKLQVNFLTEDQVSLENKIKVVYIQIGFSIGQNTSRVWFQIRKQHLQLTESYSKLFAFSYYFLFQKQSSKKKISHTQRRFNPLDIVYFFLKSQDTNDNIVPLSNCNRNLFFSFKTSKTNPVTMNLHIYITTSYLSAGRLLQIRRLTDFWCL